MHNFLKKYKRSDEKNSDWTHGSMCTPKGSYNIPNDKLKEFYRLYAAYEEEKGITERKTPNFGKMIVDLDFHFKKKMDTTAVNDKLISNIVKYLTNLLRQIFTTTDDDTSEDKKCDEEDETDESSDDEESTSEEEDSDNDEHDTINDEKYMCVVLRRPEPYKKRIGNNTNVYSYGLHIQFPNIICDYYIQYAIRNKSLEEWSLVDDVDKKLILDVNCENKLDTIYDKQVIKSTPWLLYGSTKPEYKPYDIVKIFNCDVKKSDYTLLQWITTLSIREGVSAKTKLELKNMSAIQKYIHGNETKNIHKIIRANKEHALSHVPTNTKTTKRKIERIYTYDFRLLKTALGLIKQDRVDNYEQWINVGMALHYSSITDKNKNNDYLALWKKWSEKSAKYVVGECEYLWRKFNVKNVDEVLTIGTIFHYATLDNPIAFKHTKIKDYVFNKYKEIEPDTKIVTGNVVETKQGTFVEMSTDTKCLISEKKHEDSCGYALINTNGMIFKCHEKKCIHSQLPKDEIAYNIPIYTLSNVFDIQNVYNNCVVNYNFAETKNDVQYGVHKPEYKIFENKMLNELMYAALGRAGYDIAELVYCVYGTRFKCSSDLDTTVWYEFKDHRWQTCNSLLFRLISKELPKFFVEMHQYYYKLHPKNSDEINAKKNMLMTIDKTITYIKETAKKTSLMKDVRSIFYLEDSKFMDKLDEKPFLIGFDNGVYDLEKFEFRNGRPDDYISMTVKYDYSATHTTHYADLQQFLRDIQPNKPEREYLLKYASTGLTGINTKEIITILSGKKRNGKSKFADLLKWTLGDYFVELKSNVLTSPEPQPDVPAPSLKKLNKKRLGYASEPPKNGKINNSFYKFITGNDSISVRGLYEHKETVFKPTLKLIMSCDKRPAFEDNDDSATWERTVCIEFPTTFTYASVAKNEKKKNNNILQKLPLWKQDMMLVLIEHYKLFLKDDLKLTPKIEAFTKKQKDNHDIYTQYLEERIDDSKDGSNLSIDRAYRDFSQWREKIGHIQGKQISMGNSITNRAFIKGIRQHIEIRKVNVNGVSVNGLFHKKIIENKKVNI